MAFLALYLSISIFDGDSALSTLQRGQGSAAGAFSPPTDHSCLGFRNPMLTSSNPLVDQWTKHSPISIQDVDCDSHRPMRGSK
jgi:hypothetical protein